jgi:penicillin-insensitive murein endopeptidase
MRPSRKRYFGHPELVDFIEDLGRRVHEAGVGPLLVGDLGQPMGGPAPNGHSSHQTGLDVDISLWHPPIAEKRALSRRERNRIHPRSVVDRSNKELNGAWSEDMALLLRLAATDERVSRIFVNPVIKKHLCESEKKHRGYLRRLRPWYGHDDHMHVRLRCPEGSKECVDQAEVPQGDSCDDLDWWLDDEKQAERKKGHRKYRKHVGATPSLPPTCNEIAGTVADAR